MQCRSLISTMITSRIRFRKVCALVTAALVLPALAYAEHKAVQWDKGDKDDQGAKGEKGGKGDPKVSSVPEANAGWVLIPFLGLVLVFSARQFFPKKATE
jgi:hypothetical protein